MSPRTVHFPGAYMKMRTNISEIRTIFSGKSGPQRPISYLYLTPKCGANRPYIREIRSPDGGGTCKSADLSLDKTDLPANKQCFYRSGTKPLNPDDICHLLTSFVTAGAHFSGCPGAYFCPRETAHIPGAYMKMRTNISETRTIFRGKSGLQRRIFYPHRTLKCETERLIKAHSV